LFAIIDIETTGNSHKFGQITEIAIFQHNGREITDSFSSLVKPDMDIPLFITRLTGISNAMVEKAPRFFEIARKIVEMTAGRIFVAHNVMFDYRFVQEEFHRLGYDFNRKTLCTVKLSRKLIPGHKSYSLGKLCNNLEIEINGRHRAAGDALATAKLFEILMKKNDLKNQCEAANNLKLF
jgi:DNA polymerase III subunit epsilon